MCSIETQRKEEAVAEIGMCRAACGPRRGVGLRLPGQATGRQGKLLLRKPGRRPAAAAAAAATAAAARRVKGGV
ncbi:hypothetical protein E2C01_026087 [Portunus trituberculatus]|uniref:Uncharacterized protein n=1 Tax=Portunus trituberculatus TaxID=210409 RepID=A0A5B7EHQ6_PORTR|nr:hypothetical protein [Portunus trituberculatus]